MRACATHRRERGISDRRRAAANRATTSATRDQTALSNAEKKGQFRPARRNALQIRRERNQRTRNDKNERLAEFASISVRKG